MLRNLQAEFIRLGMPPDATLARAIGCSEQTAHRKFKGVSPLTVQDAISIQQNFFPALSIEYLFASAD